MTDGTGIVHIAPAFGEDDANVGRKYELPFVQLVNGKGEMTEETSLRWRFREKGGSDDSEGLGGEGTAVRRAEIRA